MIFQQHEMFLDALQSLDTPIADVIEACEEAGMPQPLLDVLTELRHELPALPTTLNTKIELDAVFWQLIDIRTTMAFLLLLSQIGFFWLVKLMCCCFRFLRSEFSAWAILTPVESIVFLPVNRKLFLS